MMPRRARRARRQPLWIALAVAGLIVLALGRIPSARGATGQPDYPPYAGFMNDRAGLLDEPTRAQLEAFLDQLEKKTGTEFAVLTVRTTAPLTPTDYKSELFNRWHIGKKGADNGLLMLVAVEEHEVRFETGYGLEGTLPDGLESRIVREKMTPLFRANDYGGGIRDGVLACAARIAKDKGVTLEWNGSELRYDSDGGSARGLPLPPRIFALIIFIVLGSFFSLLRRVLFPFSGRRGGWWSGGSWGGGIGGFGGFGGGGFGGGGGSFGGFGGGSSGGGGGGGSW